MGTAAPFSFSAVTRNYKQYVRREQWMISPLANENRIIIILDLELIIFSRRERSL